MKIGMMGSSLTSSALRREDTVPLEKLARSQFIRQLYLIRYWKNIQEFSPFLSWYHELSCISQQQSKRFRNVVYFYCTVYRKNMGSTQLKKRHPATTRMFSVPILVKMPFSWNFIRRKITLYELYVYLTFLKNLPKFGRKKASRGMLPFYTHSKPYLPTFNEFENKQFLLPFGGKKNFVRNCTTFVFHVFVQLASKRENARDECIS